MSVRLPLLQVDAFTQRPLGGNPCAVVFDADGLDDATLQAVAREMNLSETVFLLPPRETDFRARYFTPVAEIPMAGHPTIATACALVDAGRLALGEAPATISLELPVGPVPVEIHGRGGAFARAVMTQGRPEFLRDHDAGDVAALFGLDPADLLPGAPVQTVSTGTPQLMVPVTGHAPLRRIRLDYDAYRRYREETGFFSAHVFCLEGATDAGRTFARHFVDPPDFVEDPFTGSATGAMAGYLWRHGLVEEPHFIAEQGHWMGRPGRGDVEVVGPREAATGVRVGGSAVVVTRGHLFL